MVNRVGRDELDVEDFQELGFKCGIEIHQRLDTKKLFCNCSSDMEEEPGGSVRRKLRAVPGELGEIDPAALYEFLRDRKFVYRTYSGESCEVELDEEPPHEVRKEALDIALEIAKMLNCEVPGEIHPMRKTVIDGSNTAGFQRTMLVGLNGQLETEEGEVGIQNLCLEEESSQILDRKGNVVEYGLNRLGIPLVEIGTAPNIVSPGHAAEVAEKIGKLLRSTGRVQRGIGTIRQDVNVSIEDGARVEIKGLQELDILEKTVELEVERQVSLLKIMDELNDRGASIPEKNIAVKDIIKESESDFAGELTEKKYIKAFKLEKFGGLLARKISGEKTFGKELSEYVEAHGLGGIVHSDEDLEDYGLEKEFEEISQKLEADKEDVIVLIAGDENLEKAISSVKERAKIAMEKIPEETRDSNPDGTTSYSRPLPGEARMYPETDAPPVMVSEEKLEGIEISETLDEKKGKFMEEYGLSEHLSEEILDSRFLSLFEELVDELDVEPSTVADSLTVKLKDLKKREELPVGRLQENDMREILKALEEGKITKDSIGEIVKSVLEENKNPQEVVDELETIGEEELDGIIEDVIDEKSDLLDDERAFKKLMGPVMAKVRGRISGEKVSKRLRNKIEEEKED